MMTTHKELADYRNCRDWRRIVAYEGNAGHLCGCVAGRCAIGGMDRLQAERRFLSEQNRLMDDLEFPN